jgi:DNA-binding NtrC family response regulator
MYDDSQTRPDDYVTREVRAATLVVVRGPDAGRDRRLDEPSLTIGSGPAAGLRLTDGTVSREHVRLALASDGIVVSDGGSKNGTWIGSLRIHRSVITSDVALRLGATTIEVRVDQGPSVLVVTGTPEFGAAFAESNAMRHVFAYLKKAAPSEVTILLEGESGVGKEVLARAIHDHSPRAKGPFIAIDCGAIPAGLIESEIFGHERGAFTGAERARLGLFEQADGGTVFLDELGELPLDLQPKLLRVLEQREVRPVGGAHARPIDVRVVAATNKNLGERIALGQFREDLFYRLAVARIRVPPLRERLEDVPFLATRFLRDLVRDPRAEFPPDLAAMLGSYSWPGNVRELRNVVARFALLDARDRAELFDATGSLRRDALVASSDDLSHLPFPEARKLVLERLEATYFPAVLARAGGNRSKAAELSGLARSSFYRMLDRLTKPDDD